MINVSSDAEILALSPARGEAEPGPVPMSGRRGHNAAAITVSGYDETSLAQENR
jgi:hypothetical protein